MNLCPNSFGKLEVMVTFRRLSPQLLNYVPGIAKLEAVERELVSRGQVLKEG